MKPKVRRAKLFRNGHPTIRGYIEPDFHWLCVAVEMEVGAPPSDDWMDQLTERMTRYDLFWMAEDDNKQFRSGRGPVAFVYANFDDWKLTPHTQWFKWATPRNKLRCTVEYFMKMRRDKDIGCIEVRTSEEHAKWFKRLSHTWMPLFPVGGRDRNFTPAGRPDGREWIWYMRGKRGYGRNRQPVQIEADSDTANHQSTPAATSD